MPLSVDWLDDKNGWILDNEGRYIATMVTSDDEGRYVTDPAERREIASRIVSSMNNIDAVENALRILWARAARHEQATWDEALEAEKALLKLGVRRGI